MLGGGPKDVRPLLPQATGVLTSEGPTPVLIVRVVVGRQCQKMENTKMMLERQNKELKAKLEEVENSNRAKAKAAIGKNSNNLYSRQTQFSGSTNGFNNCLGESRGKDCK